MKVAFYTPHLCLRGTTTAIHDYAKYNQIILGNESIVFYDENNEFNDKSVLQKFLSTCKTVEISGNRDIKVLDEYLRQEKCDAIYIIKKGFRNDGILPTSCKSLIHVTSMAPPSEKHGNVWCYVSDWLKSACSPHENVPVVPHMVDLPELKENMRDELGIPKNAIVFGRNGGLDTWNLPFANNIIYHVLQVRKDIYFLFQNTSIPFEHERVIHVPSTGNMHTKTKFINSCDAMIHARQEGESFGLACGEFSIKDKPVITWALSQERSHIDILGEKAHLYVTPQQMLDELVQFTRRHDDYNCYRAFSPYNVMKKFENVFLNED